MQDTRVPGRVGVRLEQGLPSWLLALSHNSWVWLSMRETKYTVQERWRGWDLEVRDYIPTVVSMSLLPSLQAGCSHS